MHLPAHTEDLSASRPAVVQDQISQSFKEQSIAAKNNEYGAVGRGDYDIGPDWSVLKYLRGLPEEQRESLRVLDLGTGDGHLLVQIRKEFSMSWDNLVGVTAEDMRYMPEVRAMKEAAPTASHLDVPKTTDEFPPDTSYIVTNIDDFSIAGGMPKALQGRKFDLIVSAVTFLWLVDPMAAFETVYNHLLAPGGLMVIGSLQLQVPGVDPGPGPECDQAKLRALVDAVNKRGRESSGFPYAAALVPDPASSFMAWWVMSKRRTSDRVSTGAASADAARSGDPPLRLAEFIEYAPDLFNGRAQYECSLDPLDGNCFRSVADAIREVEQ